MLTMRPRGTNDILPGETERWNKLENIIRQVCKEYGYQEIRTPIFEHTELFMRGVGETTDIVEKEMYSFKDRGDRNLTLRPEGTAPAARAFLEHKMYAQIQPTKIYYLGPMFRYGRPQAGRFRQFHQFGVEAFGSKDPALDVEVIGLAMDFYQRLGLKNLKLLLNSVGCPDCRPSHKRTLQEFLKPRFQELCPTCQGRYGRNPLRIFDCKSSACQEIVKDAPTITDTLCDSCAQHFEQVRKYLDSIDLPYTLDPYLVRGLDYYTNTAFEIVAEGIGAQNAVGGGGRYDGLVEEIGGPAIPAIGFGLGLERILLILEAEGLDLNVKDSKDIFIAVTGEKAKLEAFKMVNQIRKSGFTAEMDYLDRSMKAQLKFADKSNFRFVFFLGEEELSRHELGVKEMATGTQVELAFEDIISFLHKHQLK